MAKIFISSAEAGLRGHPDKIADKIGDVILDEYLRLDPYSRVGCNVMVVKDLVLIGGNIKSKADIDIDAIVRNTIKEIGYVAEGKGFDYKTCNILVKVETQSNEISSAVNLGGAGDSAIMYGYACNDTKELMPLPVILVHVIAKKIDLLSESLNNKILGPDGKIQISIKYEDNNPIAIEHLVVSVQSDDDTNSMKAKNILLDKIIMESLPNDLVSDSTKIDYRPDVKFNIGGPIADCGLSGRKVISDTYGSWVRHGGGGLSGKDPSKIDRCASYLSRYIAKNIVASGLSEKCEVQLAYRIGLDAPVAISLDFFDTGKIDELKVVEKVKKVFPLSPKDIISELDLRRPIYGKCSVYGHFGNEEPELSWEKTDKIEKLQDSF